ncbi:hypothetical protein GE061_017547 [Apolygus lucorum]|uniref:Uncharacterized protein n=1 Tax=Apolygus lucorum TaxID=248454 RepID=A0A6A4JEP1_APOLU|nr:hypothetical protein GE061_017547 [Apolygus lucorum]
MSFACTLNGFLHFLISLGCLLNFTCSLQMKDLLFVEKRSHSSFELVKEFFNRTLLPLCDLTANVCDINCCRDSDCSDENIEVFDCSSEVDSWDTDPSFSDPYYCYNNYSSPDPVLCYEIQNSPYLGTYYLEERVMKRKRLEFLLENLAASSIKKFFDLDQIELKEISNNVIYKYGVKLLFDRSKVSFTFPSEILGNGYCSYSSPVRYLLDSTAVCTSKIDAHLCEQNPRFNLKSYFEEDDDGELHLAEIYSGNVSSSIKANVRIVCSPDILEIEQFLALSDIRYAQCDDLTLVKRAKLDSVLNICMNVVRNVGYRFSWHENTLLSLDVTVVLSNVPLDRPYTTVPSKRGVPSHVTQIFEIEFEKKEGKTYALEQSSYTRNDRIAVHSFS